MPLFEYSCSHCDTEFELLVAVREQPECPQCGSKQLNKLMSVSSGRMAGGSALPISQGCPPPEAGPCSPQCCRLPQ